MPDLDADRQAVVGGLRAALFDSGLSQARFARAIGTSASRLSTYLSGHTVPSAALYLGAQRLGRALGLASERSWLTPVDAVTAIRSALLDDDAVWALRLVLQCRDHLRWEFDHDGNAATAWEAAPARIGVDGWDRFLAAVIGQEFAIRHLEPPAWTSRATTVPEPWVLASPFLSRQEVILTTPPWLSEHGIHVSARDLETA